MSTPLDRGSTVPLCVVCFEGGRATEATYQTRDLLCGCDQHIQQLQQHGRAAIRRQRSAEPDGYRDRGALASAELGSPSPTSAPTPSATAATASNPTTKVDSTLTSCAEVLSHEEILLAARIFDGCRHARHVAWPVHDDVSKLIKGTMRHVADRMGDHALARPDRDIRAQFVRITAAWEGRDHWLPVPHVMRLMREGLFIFRPY